MSANHEDALLDIIYGRGTLRPNDKQLEIACYHAEALIAERDMLGQRVINLAVSVTTLTSELDRRDAEGDKWKSRCVDLVRRLTAIAGDGWQAAGDSDDEMLKALHALADEPPKEQEP